MIGRDFLMGYVFARRHRATHEPYVRTVPKMPSRPWRIAAVLVTLLGAIVGVAAARSAGGLIAGAGLGFTIGMYVVESRWIARHHAPTAPDTAE